MSRLLGNNVRKLYSGLRRLAVRVGRLRFHFYDMLYVARYMSLWPLSALPEEQMAAKLLFFYHKIEKGLSMPPPHRLFGVGVVRDVMSLIKQWEEGSYSQASPVYVGAIAALRGYLERIEVEKLDSKNEICDVLKSFLERRATNFIDEERTPVPLSVDDVDSAKCYEEIARLYRVRRSYRDFDSTPIDESTIINAVKLAQLSPSVCNRQSSRVYSISNNEAKTRALSYQNGNRGFGHTAAQVLIVTADLRCFTDAAERNQPYVDGGLFAMSLVTGLQSQGVMSCCLNWCVPENVDRQFRKAFQIPAYERIVMFIAIGNPRPVAYVPRSHRRSTDSIYKPNLLPK